MQSYGIGSRPLDIIWNEDSDILTTPNYTMLWPHCVSLRSSPYLSLLTRYWKVPYIDKWFKENQKSFFELREISLLRFGLFVIFFLRSCKSEISINSIPKEHERCSEVITDWTLGGRGGHPFIIKDVEKEYLSYIFCKKMKIWHSSHSRLFSIYRWSVLVGTLVGVDSIECRHVSNLPIGDQNRMLMVLPF